MKKPWTKPTIRDLAADLAAPYFQLPEKIDYSHAMTGIIRDVVNYPLQTALDRGHDLQAIADHIEVDPRRLDHYRRAIGSQTIPLSKFLKLCDLGGVQIILRGAKQDLQIDPADLQSDGDGVQWPAVLDDYDLKRIQGTIESAGDSITMREALTLISHIINQAR